MKSRVCYTPVAVPFHPGHSSLFMDCSSASRQRRWLLGVSFLLILCWAIGAVCLISVRRGERSTAEALAQQRTITALFSEEMVSSRQAGVGNFALFLAKPE